MSTETLDATLLNPHFTFLTLQAFMYEVSSNFEILTQVKMIRILCWDTKVNTCASIKALVTDAALLGVRCVQHMSDAEIT